MVTVSDVYINALLADATYALDDTVTEDFGGTDLSDETPDTQRTAAPDTHRTSPPAYRSAGHPSNFPSKLPISRLFCPGIDVAESLG
jgi:hypothetical protein